MAKPATKETALWVIRWLRKAGFEALLAGGCVRDMLLGRRSADYDVATSATPAQVRRLFSHVLLVGAKFGVAMVIHRSRKVEVTTFRTDVSYSDGRRPDQVRFSSPREDALRRDFTINGMFYDPFERRVIDFVGGQEDLRAGLIRTIGRPDERFAEDYLRMLRAVRFALRLGFAIEPRTARAIRKLAARITRISGERIFEELGKMLATAGAGDALAMLERQGLAEALWPELFEARLWRGSTRRVEWVAAAQAPTLAFAALLAGLEKRAIEAITRRWGASNEFRRDVGYLADNLPKWRDALAMSLADFKPLVADRRFRMLRRIWAAQERIETGADRTVRRIVRRARAIPADELRPAPLLTGEDLKALGLGEGPRLGQALRLLYRAQLNEEIHTRREALDLAQAWIAQRSSSEP